jgi:hypothetical protein
MEKYLRPDTESTLITVRHGNTDADLALLTRTVASGGSTSDLEAAVKASHSAEKKTSAVAAPPEIDQPEHREGWVTSAHDAVTGKTVKLKAALPDLYTHHEKIAAAAAKELPELRKDAATALESWEGERIRQEQALAGEEAADTIARRIRKLRWWEVTLTVAAFLVTTFSAASASGLADGTADVTVSAVMQSLIIGIGGALSEWFLAHLIARQVTRLNLTGNRRVVVASAVVTITTLVLYAGAVSAVRYAGAHSDHVTAEVDALGSGGMAIILSVASAGIGVGLVLLSIALLKLNASLDKARQREALFAKTLTRLENDLHDAETELATTEAIARRMDILNAGFEASVTLAKREAKERDERLAERLSRLRAGHALLGRMAPGERESVITKLYRLVESSPDAPKARSSVGTALAFILAFGAFGLSACSNTRSNAILICDGTGTVPDETCTTAWLHRSFDHWEHTAKPGASFLVIPSAGSLTDTHVAIRLVLPTARNQRAAWVTSSRAALDAIAVPADGDDPSINRSNLVAALLVAMREANNFSSTDTVRLGVGSDGWLVMGKVKFERRVLTAVDVAKLIGPEGLPDLSRFDTITWCGLGSSGASAGQLTLRDSFWRDFTTLVHGHLTRTLTSCSLPNAGSLP